MAQNLFNIGSAKFPFISGNLPEKLYTGPLKLSEGVHAWRRQQCLVNCALLHLKATGFVFDHNLKGDTT